ncbi:hypothetical protein DFR51_3042 [Sphingosinicella microcystinivorans]|uniref:Uncharacterized protein n=1 Tax=Sphingosinicella microcystinivorans TaxID=335406 RepID=A0ABX9SVG6_SPHMI|nr:hypothetical protein DFR51_3042 [Sphingosinicella microcystinivorans]
MKTQRFVNRRGIVVPALTPRQGALFRYCFENHMSGRLSR